MNPYTNTHWIDRYQDCGDWSLFKILEFHPTKEPYFDFGVLIEEINLKTKEKREQGMTFEYFYHIFTDNRSWIDAPIIEGHDAAFAKCILLDDGTDSAQNPKYKEFIKFMDSL